MKTTSEIETTSRLLQAVRLFGATFSEHHIKLVSGRLIPVSFTEEHVLIGDVTVPASSSTEDFEHVVAFLIACGSEDRSGLGDRPAFRVFQSEPLGAITPTSYGLALLVNVDESQARLILNFLKRNSCVASSGD
jgi:hypothetical protein